MIYHLYLGLRKSLQVLIYGVTQSYQSLYILSFFGSVLCWDTILYVRDQIIHITSAQNHVKQHNCASFKQRNQSTNQIKGFPRRWMLLSCYMLTVFGNRSLNVSLPILEVVFSGFQSSTSACLTPFQSSYSRVMSMSSMLELSPSLLYDYHCLQWYGLFYPAISPWTDSHNHKQAIASCKITSQVSPDSFGQYETSSKSDTSTKDCRKEKNEIHHTEPNYFTCFEQSWELEDTNDNTVDKNDSNQKKHIFQLIKISNLPIHLTSAIFISLCT